MRKVTIGRHKGLKVNKSTQEEPRQYKLKRAMISGEPIEGAAPTIYTERADGVKPEYDIRADTWEIARDAMNALSKSKIAKREEVFKDNKNEAEAPSGTSDSK